MGTKVNTIGIRLLANMLSRLALLLLVGCQAFSSGDSVATIDADLTMYAIEDESIRADATSEQSMAIETLVVAGTRVAEISAENAVLGATLRASFTGTPEIQAVVVSAEDMGSSLEGDMMDDETVDQVLEAPMRVSNLSTARALDPDSGCSSGTVQQFSTNADKIYVTVRVTSLRDGSLFEVDWFHENRSVYRVSWRADYSKSFECIWFYGTPLDFPFLPGTYSATMFVDGETLGTTTFMIANS